jgi:NAD(P)-dependent dehydrogenase (short-subunit alcohol dehydrogenase family)
MQRLAGRVTIISGGGTGIGRAIAIAAASEGAHVIVAGRSRSTLEEVASLTGGQAVTCDVTQVEEVQALFSAARRITGKVDVLVNSAGQSGPLGPLATTDLAAWRTCIETNLFGAVNCLHVAADIMCSQRSGSIVNISSRMGLSGAPMRSAYVASKFALIGLTQSLAQEVGEFSVRVNAVCPGPVRGEMMNRVVASIAAEEGRSATAVADQYYLKPAALKRWVEPEEVAEAVLFLASDASAGITGEFVRVDCGRS